MTRRDLILTAAGVPVAAAMPAAAVQPPAASLTILYTTYYVGYRHTVEWTPPSDYTDGYADRIEATLREMEDGTR